MSLVTVDELSRVEVLDLLGKHGRCHSDLYPTRWWYPTGPSPENPPDTDYVQIKRDERKAKKICGGCPMQKLCLAYALTHGEPFGIWGGYSERQRNTMRRKRTNIYVEVIATRITIARRR
jgi:WhiB family transcriptional regulator, redox-sensing transcriptional regulator